MRAGACFNPRAPRGARRRQARLSSGRSGFQSTRPARGATTCGLSDSARSRVSIHAPRAGRDTRTYRESLTPTSFNPRAPRGARLAGYGPQGGPSPVSIHAPRAGRDRLGASLQAPSDSVSIHAPRAGRDKCLDLPAHELARFNPRAPRGARHARRASTLGST